MQARWVMSGGWLLAGVLACGPQAKPVALGPQTAPPDAAAASPTPETVEAKDAALAYPAADRGDTVDRYHGVDVADPYRWLEDIDSAQTREWVDAQTSLTQSVLATIEARDPIAQRLATLWNYERYGVPHKHGGVYLVSKNDGLQDQPVTYAMNKLEGERRVLLDPNTLSKDGTVALSGTWGSPDGAKVVWGVSEAGSDWQRWRVRDIATGKDESDDLRWIKFSDPTWTPDAKGFFYSRYAEPKSGDELEALNFEQKLYYHRLGTPQSDDTLVYARPDHKDWGFSTKVSDDGRYLVITIEVGTDPKTSVIVSDLRRGVEVRKPRELLTGFTARYQFLGNSGTKFYFLTDASAPRGRVVAIDLRKPGAEHWKELIAQSDDTIRAVKLIDGRFVATYLAKARSKVSVFDLRGKHLHDAALPGLGAVSGIDGKPKDKETFLSFTSFATPSTVYRYLPATNTLEPLYTPKVAFDPAAFEIKQVSYPSRDGTTVPMFIAHKRGLKLDGTNATYLYGYGGFNIPLGPMFSVPNLVWMEMGGVFAMPNLRGGGEFGEAWHQAGTKVRKQNVFDDFIAAAQYLIEQKYTAPSKLAIGGRSNGGLLVGATMTQRPELFAAALPGVGVMDMLRFNKFTIGWAWESDYGSPKNPDEFAALLAYSPYHNLKEGVEYPATMVYTADHDDRVLPAHSYKFAAALQHAHAGADPVLIRIDTKAGHGRGKPTAKQIEEWADLWGFLVDSLEMDPVELSQ